MSLAKKLQLKNDLPVRLVNAPSTFSLDAKVVNDDSGAVLVFAKNAAEVAKFAKHAVESALAGRVTWVAYPKAGQLGADINRDSLWKLLDPMGIRPISQVALDDVWSALRFRGGKLESLPGNVVKNLAKRAAAAVKTVKAVKKSVVKKRPAKKAPAKSKAKKK